MPIVGLISPKTGTLFTIEEGIAHFEEEGIMPGEAIQAILNSAAGHGGFHARTSPSIADPETTCRREQVLKRFVDYHLDPFIIWDAQEGTLWHDIFEFAGKGMEGWKQEVECPPPYSELNVRLWDRVYKCKGCEKIYYNPPDYDCLECPGVLEFQKEVSITERPTDDPYREYVEWEEIERLSKFIKKDPDDGKLVIEVFPSIFMRGRIDKHDIPYTTITDFKTEKFPKTYGKSNIPKTDWGEKKAVRDWPLQLSIYAFMLEQMYGKLPERLFVWRMYRGSREKTLTFRKFEVPLLSKEMVWNECGEHLTTLARYLQEALVMHQDDTLPIKDRQEKIKKFCATIPKDGADKKMFNNTKCHRYCVVRDLCFGLEGKTVF